MDTFTTGYLMFFFSLQDKEASYEAESFISWESARNIIDHLKRRTNHISGITQIHTTYIPTYYIHLPTRANAKRRHPSIHQGEKYENIIKREESRIKSYTVGRYPQFHLSRSFIFCRLCLI